MTTTYTPFVTIFFERIFTVIVTIVLIYIFTRPAELRNKAGLWYLLSGISLLSTGVSMYLLNTILN